MTSLRRVLSLLLLVLVALGTAAALAPSASAHPLGNFTTNTADRVLVVSSGVRVLHVVDLAEIPTLQLWQASKGVETDGERGLTDAELTAYAPRLCNEVLPQLSLVVDGAESPLSLESSIGQDRPGNGGLRTARFECALSAPDRPRESLVFTDDAGVGRNGWAEVTLRSSCGELVGSDVPVESPSALLTAYPEELLSSPIEVRTASASIEPGGLCTDAELTDDERERIDAAQPRGSNGLTNRFTGFVAREDLTVGFVAVAIIASIAFGAFHALAPGHGKTVIAAYLVGQRGTPQQAVWLGAGVTIAHTGSVLALGAVLSLTTLAGDGAVVPWTEVISGVLLCLVGGYLLWISLRRYRHAPDHTHDEAELAALAHTHDDAHEHAHEHAHDHDDAHAHDHAHDHDDAHDHAHDHDHAHAHDHTHDHDHAHDHGAGTTTTRPPLVHTHGGRTHSHAPLDDKPLGWRSLAAMGVAGGLVPSPSALVVLLGATALGHVWFGIVLVLCYGLGMAITLTAAGLLLLRTRAFLTRRGWGIGEGSRGLRLLPLVAAGLVVAIGLVLIVRGYGTASDF